MKLARSLVVLVLIFGSTSYSHAQQGDERSGQAEEDFDLDFELGDGESEESFDTEGLETEDGPLQIHGRLDLSLQLTHPDEPVDGQNKKDLRLSEVSLNVIYEPLDWLVFQTEIEAEREDDDKEEFELDQLHVTLQLGKNLPKLRGGINYVPFGYERYYYAPPRNPFVNRPMAFRLIFPGTYPDLGVFIFGELVTSFLPKINYEFAGVLGLRGPDREDRREFEVRVINNLEDNNKEWQYSGRLGLVVYDNVDDPSRVALLFELGASFLTGLYDAEDQHRLSLFGVDLRVRVGDFSVLLEYIEGRTEFDSPEDTRESRGMYCWIMYKRALDWVYLRSLTGALRFGSVDPDRRVRAANDLERYSFVLGLEPYPNLKLKVQVEKTRERIDAFRQNRQALLFQIGFNF